MCSAPRQPSAGGIVRKADRRFSRIDCPYDIALDDGAEVVPASGPVHKHGHPGDPSTGRRPSQPPPFFGDNDG